MTSGYAVVAPQSRSRVRAEASRGSGSAAGCRIRSRWRDRRASSATSASMASSVCGELFEAFLLGPVDVVLLDPVVSADDQVEPDEQFKVRAEPVLHRQPHVPVDILAPAGQPHEQVVAEEVGLAQLEPGVVQGLEDPVHVVAALGGDLDDRQSRPDRLLDAGDVLVVIWVVHAGEHGAEELVRLCHGTGRGRAGSTEDDRPVRVPVCLGGKQPQVIIALAELVDQVLPVDPVSVAPAAWSRMAARASIRVVRRCWPSTSSQRLTPAACRVGLGVMTTEPMKCVPAGAPSAIASPCASRSRHSCASCLPPQL